MADTYSLGELATVLISFALTVAFAAWAAVLKRSAEDMGHQIESAISELRKLREEIHQDRLVYERRLARLENHIGIIQP